MLHHTLAPFTSLTPQDLQKRLGFSVGFDNLFDNFLNMDITRDTGYPPYNIRKLNEYQYAIEMALAGFSKEDIEVEAEDGKLTVRSKSETGEERGEISDNNENFVHRGIAKRSFLRQFNLSDDIIVKSADLKDGMLIVSLERVVPDEKKPKLIPIG